MATEETSGDVYSRYVGEQVKGEAATRGISTAKLARLLGMDRSVLVRYMKGSRSFPLPVLYEAARVIGVPVSLLSDRALERMELDRDLAEPQEDRRTD